MVKEGGKQVDRKGSIQKVRGSSGGVGFREGGYSELSII